MAVVEVTTLGFEQRYFDDSGVSISVRFNRNNTGQEVNIEHHGTSVDFPADELDWLIECLRAISYKVKP